MADLYGTYSKRIKLTIDHTKIDADVTWFPITVFFTVTQGEEIFSEFDADGDYMKCAFTKADGVTELYAEMELFDVSESKAIYHVSLDGWVIDNDVDTDFYYYYDNDAADNTNYIGTINTVAGGNVWDSDFKAVYHMVDATTSTILDSTSNNNGGTKKAANEPIEATGQVGQAQDFDGTDDYITAEDSASLDHAAGFTLEVVADPDNTDVYGFLLTRYRTAGADEGYQLYQYTTGAGVWEFWLTINDVSKGIDSDSAPSGAFQHVVAVRDADGVMNMYIDGAVQTETDTLSGAIDIESKLYIGSYINLAQNYAGIMDEVRISNIARSAAWLKATYNTLWDTLLTYGSQEPPAEETNAIFFGMNF